MLKNSVKLFNISVQQYNNNLRLTLPYCTGREQTDGEKRLVAILKQKMPKSKSVLVEDISGGCGSMYQIHVVSEEFKGKSLVDQHRLVSDILKDEVKSMHGIRIFTQTPKIT